MSMQTILGAGGGIGQPLAKELSAYTQQIRLVSRNPRKVNNTDQLFALNANNLNEIDKAIEGSSVVYVTIGFEYQLKVWEQTWPPFLKEVIDSCIRHQAKLVFFDNVYMYDVNAIPMMTESSLIQPPSKKGLVRAKLHQMIMDACEKRNLSAIIARAADFYGPQNKNSALTIMAAANLMKGKKAQAFGNINCVHTYTYTPDAAKATALLGNTPTAFNQVWHVPTTKEKLTNKQWIELIAAELDVAAKIQVVPTWMVKLIGLFVPIMREFPEMMYQYERDYIFDSTKFEQHFHWGATSPQTGIKALIADLKSSM